VFEMWIYVVKSIDDGQDFHRLHNAYLEEDDAIDEINRLEEDENKKRNEYIEWVENRGEEYDMPDFGDRIFNYEMVWLEANKI
jgi:hypothetical protein